MTDDDQRYFRNVYDHLIRIGDMVDTYRDLLTGRDGRLPLDRLEPAQRGHEAARDHRHRLHAAHVHDGLLRPELRAGWSTTSAGSGTSSCFGIGLELITLAIVLGYFWHAAERLAQPVRPSRR